MSAFRTIRAAVCKRAEGACEHCGAWVGLNGETGEADHFEGRSAGRPQESVENVWLLCGGVTKPNGCHFQRTNNNPSAAYWLEKFIGHCIKHGFTSEQLRAEDRLLFVRTRSGLSVRGCEV